MRAMLSRPALASSAPVVFLVVSLGLIAVLAWQAVAAAAGHRTLARRVLRDYADLAAIELIRRGSTFVFTYGFDVAVQALARADDAGSSGALPSRSAIVAALPAQSQRAIELMGDVIRVDTARARIDPESVALPPAVQSEIIGGLRLPITSSAPSRVIVSTVDGHTHLFAFANTRGSGPVHLGFDVRLDAVAAVLREFVLREPLLPPSLAVRETAQSSLSIDVRSPAGRSLLGSPIPDVPGALVAVRPWSDDASRRALPGFTVVSAIDPAAASSLIIGGLPESRIGWLLALFAVASVLAIVAVVQLRQERALAALRQDFVTRTSHELRTPVARIRIFTDTLLLDRVRTDAERRDAVYAIDRAARRLSLLIENVLQFSRMESRDVSQHVESTDLVAFVRDVVQEFETTISGARVTVADVPLTAYSNIDREAMRQALLNVLDNAWKYGGSDRSIDVAMTSVDDEIRISVSDSGPGVPEHDRTRIWEPYVRLDRDRRSSVAGTGIGLAVVRDVLHRHRGTAWVETAAGAGGATFVLALPAAASVTEPSRSLA